MAVISKAKHTKIRMQKRLGVLFPRVRVLLSHASMFHFDGDVPCPPNRADFQGDFCFDRNNSFESGQFLFQDDRVNDAFCICRGLAFWCIFNAAE